MDQKPSNNARAGSAATVPTPEQLAALSDEELAKIDVVVLNLAVAKQYPGLENLDVARYQWTLDKWANGVQKLLIKREPDFQLNPAGWRNDIRFFRIAVLCHFLYHVLGIRYIEHQQRMIDEMRARGEKVVIAYTDLGQLLLHGLIDTRRGTCANMPALFLAIARRLGWPVHLICAESHLMCRFDDGQVCYNIDVVGISENLAEGMTSANAVEIGSDLRSLTPRETLGVFLRMRARLFHMTNRWQQADEDCCFARILCPRWLNLMAEHLYVIFRRELQAYGPDQKNGPLAFARRMLDKGTQFRASRPEMWMDGAHFSAIPADRPIQFVEFGRRAA